MIFSKNEYNIAKEQSMYNTNNYGLGNYGYQFQNAYQPAYIQPKKYSPVVYTTEEEIKAYILQPNEQISGFDAEKSVLYIKTADNLGRPNLKKYRYEEIFENENIVQPVNIENMVSKDDLKDLATKEDINLLQEKYTELEKMIKIKQVPQQQVVREVVRNEYEQQ
jgi:hypothetical protein